MTRRYTLPQVAKAAVACATALATGLTSIAATGILTGEALTYAQGVITVMGTVSAMLAVFLTPNAKDEHHGPHAHDDPSPPTPDA